MSNYPDDYWQRAMNNVASPHYEGWTPRSERNNNYCDWLIDKGYDPCDQEEDDQCYAQYLREKKAKREAKREHDEGEALSEKIAQAWEAEQRDSQ